MSNLILFWHRRDLRINDNLGLAMARRQTPKIVGIFCLDPDILKRDDIAPVRVTYMLGCLAELQQKYVNLGSQLLILSGSPQEKIPALASALKADAIFGNNDVEPYGVKRDHILTDILEKNNIQFARFWDQLLHTPDEIFSGNKQPYTVYTPFWKNWISKSKLAPIETLPTEKKYLIGLTDNELEIAKNQGILTQIPTAKELGFNWGNDLIIAPGEASANRLLDQFSDHAIYEYDQDRNFPSINGTSKLSAPLKFGVISIRTIWEKTLMAISNSKDESHLKNVETWQKELAWREFYQHALYHFPELSDGAYRRVFQNFPWVNNEKHFQLWCEGKTGYPIIDAAMRELNTTGWMHNRCRMIVANFLTKDLIINWQWGEKYFMQKLIDGDMASNNGGWQWSASSGMDPRPLRIFNPYSQSEKFDGEARYIRHWLPELKNLDTTALISGKITPLERSSYGYPNPIVDHHYQQQKFKTLYQEQKNNLTT